MMWNPKKFYLLEAALGEFKNLPSSAKF